MEIKKTLTERTEFTEKKDLRIARMKRSLTEAQEFTENPQRTKTVAATRALPSRVLGYGVQGIMGLLLAV